jgi:hypothetical protein
MTATSKAALRAELEAALANYRGSVKQCPAAPPPEAELEALDDEDEADEEDSARTALAMRSSLTSTSGWPTFHDDPKLLGTPEAPSHLS